MLKKIFLIALFSVFIVNNLFAVGFGGKLKKGYSVGLEFGNGKVEYDNNTKYDNNILAVKINYGQDNWEVEGNIGKVDVEFDDAFLINFKGKYQLDYTFNENLDLILTGYYTDASNVSYSELMLGINGVYNLNNKFTPYAGLGLFYTEMAAITNHYIGGSYWYSSYNTVKNENKLGLVLGTDYNINDNIILNAEFTLLSQTMFKLTLDYKYDLGKFFN